MQRRGDWKVINWNLDLFLWFLLRKAFVEVHDLAGDEGPGGKGGGIVGGCAGGAEFDQLRGGLGGFPELGECLVEGEADGGALLVGQVAGEQAAGYEVEALVEDIGDVRLDVESPS